MNRLLLVIRALGLVLAGFLAANPALAVVVPYAGNPTYVPQAAFAPVYVPHATFQPVVYSPYAPGSVPQAPSQTGIPMSQPPVFVPHATFAPAYVPNAGFNPVIVPSVPTPTLPFPCITQPGSFCGYAPTPGPQPPLYPTPTIHPTPQPTFGPTPAPIPSLPPFPCSTFFSKFCGHAPNGVYVILGDSVAQGLYGAPGYADIVEDHWEQSSTIELDSRQLARSGWHSSHLAAALQQDPLFKRHIAEADVVTWNIGGNDLRIARDLYYQGRCGGNDNQDCLRHAVTSFRSNWNVIVTELTRARSQHGTALRSMDLYNPFVKEDMAQGTHAILDGYFDQVNQHIASSLRANNIPYAQVSTAFNGSNGLTDPADLGFIAFDGYHPNPAGHRVIAQHLIQLGTPVITPDTTPLNTPNL